MVAQAILMFHLPLENVSNCFDATVRMPGEPSLITAWVVVAKVVQHQKWVTHRWIGKAKGPMQMDACTL